MKKNITAAVEADQLVIVRSLVSAWATTRTKSIETMWADRMLEADFLKRIAFRAGVRDMHEELAFLELLARNAWREACGLPRNDF